VYGLKNACIWLSMIGLFRDTQMGYFGREIPEDCRKSTKNKNKASLQSAEKP